MNFLFLFLQIIAVLLAIDFISGLVHWAEDTFGSNQTPIFGKWIVVPNVTHHENPLEFTKKSWLQSSWDLTLASGLVVLIFWFMGHLTWHIWLFSFIGANANQLHKYSHLPKQNVPLLVRFLQEIRILQTSKHHSLHHSGQKNTAYCVVTPYLNLVLDKIHFWRLLERITIPIWGTSRRDDIKI